MTPGSSTISHASPHRLQHRVTFTNHVRCDSVCFQQLTHSSQFTKSSIPFVFFGSRTLCEKHRGVGCLSAVQNTEIANQTLTPMESDRSVGVPSHTPSKPFRILLFQNRYPPTPLESISFANVVHRVPAIPYSSQAARTPGSVVPVILEAARDH